MIRDLREPARAPVPARARGGRLPRSGISLPPSSKSIRDDSAGFKIFVNGLTDHFAVITEAVEFARMKNAKFRTAFLKAAAISTSVVVVLAVFWDAWPWTGGQIGASEGGLFCGAMALIIGLSLIVRVVRR